MRSRQLSAESPTSVVIEADAFLGDVANLKAQFDAVASNPGHDYKLDPGRSFFTDAKAFPRNTILRVSQTWVTDSPDTIDNAPDARSIEVKMTYNVIAAPKDGYMPRIADPRIGYFEQPLLNFKATVILRATSTTSAAGTLCRQRLVSRRLRKIP